MGRSNPPTRTRAPIRRRPRGGCARGRRRQSCPAGARGSARRAQCRRAVDLLALTWLGRGEYSLAEAREEASDMRDKHIPEDLIGTPKLGDFLEEGLAQLGY